MKVQSKKEIPIKGLIYFIIGAFVLLLIIILVDWDNFMEGFEAGFNGDTIESTE